MVVRTRLSVTFIPTLPALLYLYVVILLRELSLCCNVNKVQTFVIAWRAKNFCVLTLPPPPPPNFFGGAGFFF